MARRRQVDSQRRRLLRKSYKKDIPRVDYRDYLQQYVRRHMRLFPSSDVERFMLKMLFEHHAKTWDEVENAVLEGYTDEVPAQITGLIFEGEPAEGYRSYNAR